MNLIKKLRSLPKRTSALVAILALAIIVPASLFAWGPSRNTYTIESPASEVTFNSITNNPNYGDERNFVTIKDAANTAKGGWVDDITVQNGKEYYVRMYVHNNAASNLNLVANNVTARFNVPTQSASRIQVDGYLAATNANPGTVWDQAVFSGNSKFTLDYIEGSAEYTNNVFTAGTPRPDTVISSGVALGYDKMDGNIPGCFQYSGFLIFKVKAVSSEFTIEKTVRLSNATDRTFKESVVAKPGDNVDYQIYFKNTGGTQLTDVVVSDTLPKGVSYIGGTTYLHNSDGTNKVADGVTTNGLNIGGYMPNGDAYLKFTAKVAEKSTLSCGDNNLVNIAKVVTTVGTQTNGATVTVTGDTCTELPHTGPADTAAAIFGLGAIVAGAVYFMNSRRQLGVK